MHHADYLDAIGYWEVEDQVIADRKAAQTCAQFASFATGKRGICQHIERGFDANEQRIGGSRIILGDLVPDRGEVDLSLRALEWPICHSWPPDVCGLLI